MEEKAEIIEMIEKMASQLTPPSQMAAILNINEDSLKLAITRHGSKTRIAFLRGIAKTADKLRQNNIDLANAGSPDAIRSCFASMHDMINDLSE
jgi:hypothetical protein